MQKKKQEQNSELADAPQHIKLAVDLIQMLEESKIAPSTAIAALEIVIADLNRHVIKPDE